MARKGRVPKPSNVIRLKSNPSRRPQRVEPVPMTLLTPLNRCIQALNLDARRIARELIRSNPGRFYAVDASVVAMYCSEAERVERLRKQIEIDGEIVAGRINPAIRVLKMCELSIVRAGAELGVSPTSRLRLAVVPSKPAPAADDPWTKLGAK
jgi:phage terminase small subunit